MEDEIKNNHRVGLKPLLAVTSDPLAEVNGN
jgi:hypothetical protein